MKKQEEDTDTRSLLIWLNGQKKEDSFYCKISPAINTLKRLKDSILNELRLKISTDKIRIFNYKGIEIDNADIEYLRDNQMLYVSLNNENFNAVNYVREYEFVKWIKSGGYGKVFVAKHVITGQEVAIKQIDTSKLLTEEIYNISREAGYMENFVHKNIIKLLNYYAYKEDFYFVMDYAKGGELSKFITVHKVVSEKNAKRIFKQIHDAVKYIHSKGVVHRDLKPLNILFLDEECEHLVLIDFGISGVAKGNIKENIKSGTARFLPPELASGLTFISNPKIDIWAMGVILYLMLFGKYPFDAEKISDMNQKIISAQHKYPKNIIVSQKCTALIDGLLEKNQGIRIDISSPLFDDWFNDTAASDTTIYDESIKEEEEEKVQIIEKNKTLEDYINSAEEIPEYQKKISGLNLSLSAKNTNKKSPERKKTSFATPVFAEKSPEIKKRSVLAYVSPTKNRASQYKLKDSSENLKVVKSQKK